MTIADKLTILAASKEMVRLKLGIGKDVPFDEYGDYVGWDGITSELGQSTTTAVSQKLFTDKVVGIESRVSNTIHAFATKALMTASALVNGDYAQVTDDTVNNGLYIKTAGAWVKSKYGTASSNNESLNKITSTINISSEFKRGNVSSTGSLISVSPTNALLQEGVLKGNYTGIEIKSMNPLIKVRLATWEEGLQEFQISPALNYVKGNTRAHYTVLAHYEDDREITDEDINTVIPTSVKIKVGSDLSKYLERLDEEYLTEAVPYELEQGSFHAVTGNLIASNSRARLKGFKIPALNSEIQVEMNDSDLEFCIILWDTSGKYETITDYASSITRKIEGFYNITIRYKDSRPFTISNEIEKFQSALTVQRVVSIRSYVDAKVRNADDFLVNVEDSLVSYELHQELESGSYFNKSGKKVPSPNRARTVNDRITLPEGSPVVIEALTEDLEIIYGTWSNAGVYSPYTYQDKILFDYSQPFNYIVRFKDERVITDDVLRNYVLPNIRLTTKQPLKEFLQNLSRAVGSDNQGGSDNQEVPENRLSYADLPRYSSVPYGQIIVDPLDVKQTKFDNLVEGYHGETTKELIGTSTIGDYEVYGYTLTPPEPTMTVAITMHVHGNEPYNPSGFYALLGEMQRTGYKHEFIKWLKDNVKWYVIPFVSPHSIVINSRTVSGINPNRNTDHDWIKGDGTNPFSLKETKNVRDFFIDKKDEIDFHLDVHDIPSNITWNVAYRPAYASGYTWVDELHEARDFLASVNGAKAGANYSTSGGIVSGYFYGVLGVPSVTAEHSVPWWRDRGCTYDQHSAKALEQLVVYLSMFKQLFENYRSYRNSAFYNRRFEMSFSSLEFGHSSWTKEQRLDAFRNQDLLSEDLANLGVFVHTPANYTKTVLIVSGLTEDSGNSDFVVLRSLQRIQKGDELLLDISKKQRLVIVPSVFENGLDSGGLITKISNLQGSYQSDYTIVVKSEDIGGQIGSNFIASPKSTYLTKYTSENLHRTPLSTESPSYPLSTRSVEINLLNSSTYSHLASHDVAEWVRIVVNDIASYCN